MSQLDIIARHISSFQPSDLGSICASIDELTDIVRVLTEDNDNWRRAELAARRERDHLRSQLDDVLSMCDHVDHFSQAPSPRPEAKERYRTRKLREFAARYVVLSDKNNLDLVTVNEELEKL